MAAETRTRGAMTTPEPPVLPGRAAKPRALTYALVFAIALHAPLLPTRLVAWLDTLWAAKTEAQPVPVDAEAIVPVDLDLLEEEAPATSAPAGEAAKATASDDPSAPGANAAPIPSLDAGVPPDAGDALDAGVPDAGPKTKPLATDAGPRDAGADAGDDPYADEPRDAGLPSADAGPIASVDAGAPTNPTVREPAAASGGAGTLASKRAHVQVLISGVRWRGHELGEDFGKLLTQIPQWSKFFGGTSLNPIKDFDHLLITGPQFADSRAVVAVMDWNSERVTEAKIRAAITALVAKSTPPGAWIDDAPVPAASAKIDGGDRIFAMVPAKKLVAVIPGDAKDQLAKMKDTKGFSASADGLLVHLVEPWKPFNGSSIKIPKSFKWLRVRVSPAEGGAADVVVEAMDESAASATKHARELTDSIAVASLGLFDDVKFAPDGTLVRCNVRMSKSRLKMFMTLAQAALPKAKK